MAKNMTTSMESEIRQSDVWQAENLYQDVRLHYRNTRMIYDSKTDHQRLCLFENPVFGRMLTLDGVVQVTTKDEFIYHEMMVHVPIFSHGSAKRILIIGGGDGGILREVIRHKTVEHVTMIEIDQGVVDFCREHMPSISDGAFDDARLCLKIADGADFVRQTKDKFDVIIIDSTDPIGPGEILFTDHFYNHVHNCLADGGIMVTQNGVPFMQGDELAHSLRAFSQIFADYSCYLTPVPTYAFGPLAMGWASKSSSPRQVTLSLLQERIKTANFPTRYYNASVHLAAFALPNHIQALVPSRD